MQEVFKRATGRLDVDAPLLDLWDSLRRFSPHDPGIVLAAHPGWPAILLVTARWKGLGRPTTHMGSA